MMTSGFGRNYIEVIRQRVVVFLDLRAGPPSARLARLLFILWTAEVQEEGAVVSVAATPMKCVPHSLIYPPSIRSHIVAPVC